MERTPILLQFIASNQPTLDVCPDVDMEAHADRLMLRKRKDYLNLWEPLFEGRWIGRTDGRLMLEGYFRRTSLLEKLSLFHNALLVAGALTALFCLYNLAIDAVLPEFRVRVIAAAVFLIGMLALNVLWKRRCAQHYARLAQEEESFLVEFLRRKMEQIPTQEPIELHAA
jgi:hypothetical protein